VLKCFKNLHLARKKTFADDIKVLTAARIQINEEFKKNKDLKDVRRIEEVKFLIYNRLNQTSDPSMSTPSFSDYISATMSLRS
jgi:hypothetical protein